MKGHTVTALFLLVAIFLYSVGLAMAAGVLFFLGAVAEIVFWILLFRGSAQSARLRSDKRIATNHEQKKEPRSCIFMWKFGKRDPNGSPSPETNEDNTSMGLGQKFRSSLTPA